MSDKRVVVTAGTRPYYQRGVARLVSSFPAVKGWDNMDSWVAIPEGCPQHEDKPYAFKAYFLNEARKAGATKLLWADACILPLKDLWPIWEHAAANGVWLSENGYTNYEWTASSAYQFLFPGLSLASAREVNRRIPHVVATTFAIDLNHVNGRAFLDEYVRLALETRAFCGPWTNQCFEDSAQFKAAPENSRVAPCGPDDVRGHRHDQTAASVLAWKIGAPLTKPPAMFAYAGNQTKATILVADGSYL